MAAPCPGPTDCAVEGRPQDRLSFDVDFDREAVAGAFPINWVWFTPGFVLFQYSASINGHHHALQTYVLDRNRPAAGL